MDRLSKRILLLSCGLAGSVLADTVTLKNGNVLDGIIQQETPSNLVLGVGVGSVTLKKSNIQSIRRLSAQTPGKMEEEWRQHYFSHPKFLPPELHALASSFNSVEAKRQDAQNAIRSLAKNLQQRKALRSELDGLRQAQVATANNLPPDVTRDNLKQYNELVERNNGLSARMTVVSDALVKGYRDDDAQRALIASYVDRLGTFSEEYAAAKQAYLATGDVAKASVFFSEVDKRIDNYGREIQQIDIPHEDVHGHVVVTVRINDKVDGRFMLDTGASFVTFSEELAGRLNLNASDAEQITVMLADGSSRKVTPIILDSVEVGGTRLEGVAGAVTPTPPGPDVDGLLGMSFLGQFAVKIDPQNNRLTLSRFNPQP